MARPNSRPPARFATFGLVAALVSAATTGCTGFLRSISSDNAVEWEQTATEYRFDSRDLTLVLPGQWSDASASDKLAGASEYDSTSTRDDTSVRLRASTGRTNLTKCSRELTETLTAAGWSLDKELSGDVAGLPGAGFAGTLDGRYQQAWCVVSNQSAEVLIIVQLPDAPDAAEAIDALVRDSLTWKP